MIGSAHVLYGMDAIINCDNVKQGLDLKDLERKMISGGMLSHATKDPQERYNEELQDAASKLGISFGEPKKKEPIRDLPTRPDDHTFRKSDDRTSRKSDKHRDNGSSDHKSHTREDANIHKPHDDQPDDGLSTATLDSGYDPLREESSSEDDRREDTHREDGHAGDPALGSSGDPDDRADESSHDKWGSRDSRDLHSRTREQERRSHIDSVMGLDSGAEFSFEKEKREDMKHVMLAEIDALITSLADEDLDLSRIPKVDRKSEFAAIESVLKMLRHKNDHTRYCSFAEEFLLFGAYALEDLFDGKRTWFDRYQPDLTGWHNHVNVKLKRMRHDTGQIVSGVMQDYNIGPGARVLLELVPNMVLYSKMRKQQHGQPGLYSDEEMIASQNRIRNMEG